MEVKVRHSACISSAVLAVLNRSQGALSLGEGQTECCIPSGRRHLLWLQNCVTLSGPH
jgi:hypothetical protein